jgi:hypothetical protein
MMEENTPRDHQRVPFGQLEEIEIENGDQNDDHHHLQPRPQKFSLTKIQV